MAKKDTFEEYAQLEEYASAEDISRVRAELLTCRTQHLLSRNYYRA